MMTGTGVSNLVMAKTAATAQESIVPATTKQPTDKASFGSQILFDLTAIQQTKLKDNTVPEVIVLATDVSERPQRSVWRTVIGFGITIATGLALGLLLARVLLH